jgi:nucleoside-diphosphate-sugar epimerase
MIKNLVIGSEGFVGAPLCAYLEKKGEEAIRFDIKRGEQEDGRNAVLPLDNIDRVYFLAWEVGGAKYLYKEDTQLHQLRWNISLMNNIMPQLEKHKTPFIFVSSQLAEEVDTIYGATKRVGELWTERLGGACVRLWNIYGTPEIANEKSHVAGDFVYQALTTGEIRMMTTGEEKRQFIHINDVCDGLHLVLENNLNDSIYDLTSFEWSSVRDIADLIAKNTGAKVIAGTAKGSARRVTATMGRPHGWAAKISLEAGIEMMVKEAAAQLPPELKK